jgi:hypothetical protein
MFVATSNGLLMIAIRPSFWRPSSVFWVVVIGGFCLSPVVFQAGAFPELMGLGVLAAMTVLLWLGMRPARLEITETEVRARHGWSSAPLGKKEALRSEIRSIHYRPSQVTFRGADGQSLMEASELWTVADMVKAAAELRVPLYDDRVEGLLRARELSEGRLVYDPVSGLVVGKGHSGR